MLNWTKNVPTVTTGSHSSVGQSVRLITVRSAVRARVGPVLSQEEKRDANDNRLGEIATQIRNGARGVVVSRSLCMRKALGSNPSGSIVVLVCVVRTPAKSVC